MTQSKGGIAAAFAAGLASGGIGGDQLSQAEIDAANGRVAEVQAIVEQLDTNNPTIKSYVRFASEQTITDVLDDKVPAIRADQLRQLAEDIEADVTPGESVALNGLVQRLAEKVRIDDPNWLIWYGQNLGTYLQSQISIGLGVGNLAPDQLVDLGEVISTMKIVAALHTPPIPAGAMQSIVDSQEAVRQSTLERNLKQPGITE